MCDFGDELGRDTATAFLGTAVSKYDIDELDDYGKKPRESRQKAVEVRRPDGSVAKSRGERTFYGAFTGGFSAGYWNTVGSKEGWEPAAFSSSRSKRSQTSAQQVEDYMDEEDRREHQASHQTIQPKAHFAQDETSKNPHEAALSGLVSDVKKHVFGKLEERLGARLLAAAATGTNPAPVASSEATTSDALTSSSGPSASSSSSRLLKKRYGCAPPPPDFAAGCSVDGPTRQQEAVGDVAPKRRLHQSSSSSAGPESSGRWPLQADLERLWQGKTDLHGIGYGLGGSHADSHSHESLIPKQRRLYLSDKKYSQARDFADYGAFGTGVFDMEEYDVWEDIYNKGNRRALCNEEVVVTSQECAERGERELPAPPRAPSATPAKVQAPQRGCLPGFAQAQQPEESLPDITRWEVPLVPRGFRGVHQYPGGCVQEAETSSEEHRKLLEFLREHGDRRLMEPASRAAMLGERTREPAPDMAASSGMQPPALANTAGAAGAAVASADGPLWRGVSDEQRCQLLQNLGRHFVVGKDQDMDGALGQQEPFRSDPQKQRRYAAFCAAVDGGASLQDAGRISCGENEAELLEFGRVHGMFRVQTPGIEVGPSSASGEKQQPLVRRVVESWAPGELLCKRWGVPYTSPLPAPVQQSDSRKPRQASVPVSVTPTQPEPTGSEAALPQRPPQSLFTAIFGDGALSDNEH